MKEGTAQLEANFGKYERAWLATYKRDGFTMNYAQLMEYTQAVSKLDNQADLLKEMAMREYIRRYEPGWLQTYDDESA